MNCYFHPDFEAVVKCPKCGVPMCRQCESKALYRADYGKGAAYCRRCSMDIFDSFLKACHKDLSTMFIALFVTAPVVTIGLVLVISGIVDRDYFGKLLTGLLFWLICGILFSLLSKRLSSQENNQGISRFDMYDAVDRAVNPVSNLLIHMIGFTLA